MPTIFTITCSPRVNGNTNAIGEIFSKNLIGPSYQHELISLNSVCINPCTACDFCATYPGQCTLDPKDDAGWIFDKINKASVFVIIAPIFFYGPPAQLKALIDRAQKYWSASKYTYTKNYQNTLKPAFTVMIAARTNGKNLFMPSLLIVRCFLHALGYSLKESLLLRGLDDKHDFLQSKSAIIQVENLVKKIQKNLDCL